jgi:ABC-type uncharacterized transport system permease subunit
MIRLERRPQMSKTMMYLSPVFALGLTLLAGIALFSTMQVPPLEALYAFFVEPLNSVYGLTELGVKATPLILIGVALSIGFRANVWNIGAEGQLTIGALFGSGVALYFYEVEGFWVLPLMLVAAIVGGMLWAAIPALLRTRFNASEILVSLMLTYVATLVLSYLVHGPWRDPEGFNFPQSRMFHDAATLPIIFPESRLHLGFALAVLVVIAAWIMISRTVIGFQVRVIGSAPRAGQYAGFSEKAIIWMTLLIGGACAGLAGIVEVAGPIGQLQPSISPGYGFTAIIVAFVGRLHPLGVFLAGLLMALSYLGGENAQIGLNLPLAVTGVFQGLLLFMLLACDVLIRYRIRLGTGS